MNFTPWALGLAFSRLTGTLIFVTPAATSHAPLLFVNVSVKTAGVAPLVVAVVKQLLLTLSTVTKVDVSDGKNT